MTGKRVLLCTFRVRRAFSGTFRAKTGPKTGFPGTPPESRISRKSAEKCRKTGPRGTPPKSAVFGTFSGFPEKRRFRHFSGVFRDFRDFRDLGDFRDFRDFPEKVAGISAISRKKSRKCRKKSGKSREKGLLVFWCMLLSGTNTHQDVIERNVRDNRSDCVDLRVSCAWNKLVTITQ